MYVPVHEGQHVNLLEWNPADDHGQAACRARAAVADSGFELKNIRGCLTFSCVLNYAAGGEAKLEQIAREFGDALGLVPTLGIIGGPEFGSHCPSFPVAAAFSTSLMAWAVPDEV